MSENQREAARLRKRKQRERQRQQAKDNALSRAAREEQAAEALAPAIMRNPIIRPARTNPDGSVTPAAMIVGARVQIINGRAVRTVPLACPIASARSSKITEAHRRAARQLQLDWDGVGAGVGVGAIDYLRSGSGGGGDGHGSHERMMGQVRARTRLDAAMAFLGAFCGVISRIVLDGIPVAAWASEKGMETGEALEFLVLALDRLVLAYDPPEDAVRPVRIRAVAPARNEYEI